MQKKFIQSLKILAPGFKDNRFLLAVSGGIDSMVMLHLFMSAELDFVVAHCNFKLRDEESDRDENFVCEFCSKHNIKLLVDVCDASEYAKDYKVSIQEAARETRYSYFFKLLNNSSCNYIVTAHNRDDVLETFFINLNRSAGIKGLASIPPKNELTIRPLLGFSRLEIETYAEEHGIKYVEDSSNAEDKYLRNRIRHHLLPLAEEIMPGFAKALQKSTQHLRSLSDSIEDELELRLEQYEMNDSEALLDIIPAELIDDPFAEQLLLKIMHRFGFPTAIIDDVFLSFFSNESKFFYSGDLRMIVRTDQLAITENPTKGEQEFLLFEDLSSNHLPFRIEAKYANYTSISDIITNKKILQLNKKKLVFPLKIRRWRAGDKFTPLGMNGRKKISDYLTDKKLTRTDKEQVFLLECENEITAILGFEISENYALHAFPSEVLVLKIFK